MKTKGPAPSGRTPMDAALNYLTARPRTVMETELYLDSKNFGEYEVYETIERLKELGYLDDVKFARDFVASRLRAKPVSRRKLQDQLYGHKLPKDIIDEALSEVTDETELDNAYEAARKYFEQLSGLPGRERAERTGRRLMSRGFDYETARKCVLRLENERE
ncbi:MAG: recombination regulator RecX [Firmicutes bacterium ADurb.Bin182]|nr:MAG: recombination regulator RecX [Firmicutes bacterium ADurb.Bin182]